MFVRKKMNRSGTISVVVNKVCLNRRDGATNRGTYHEVEAILTIDLQSSFPRSFPPRKHRDIFYHTIRIPAFLDK